MNTKQLKSAAKELNEFLGLEPPISLKGDDEELIEGLKEGIEEIKLKDKFTPETQAVIDELKSPAKGSKGKKSKPEDDDDDDDVPAKSKKNTKKPDDDPDEEDDEPDDDPDDDDDDEKPDDDPDEEDDEPKKKSSKKLSPIKKKTKKEAEEDDDDDEDEPEEDEKPKKKSSTPAKKSSKGEESFQAVADRLLKSKASEKEINSTFAKLYKERKGVSDSEFTKKRAAIYMKIAKEKK